MADNKFDEFEINDLNLDFIERMLKSLPSNIYFKDMEGKYVFCTHYWNHINTPDDDPTWTIRGKTDIEIRKDKENAIKAMEEDQRIISTQKGTTYEIHFTEDGKEEYLQLIKNPVFDANNNMIGIVGLINNITATKQLENKLEIMATKDQLTGFRNRSYLDIWLEQHKDDQMYPLSFVMADCNNLKRINDVYGHLVGDEYIKTAANIMKQHLPESGRVIRMGGDEFLLLLPNVSYDEAQDYINKVVETGMNTKVIGNPVSIALGASTCNEKNFRIENYIRQADDEMYKRKIEAHNKN